VIEEQAWMTLQQQIDQTETCWRHKKTHQSLQPQQRTHHLAINFTRQPLLFNCAMPCATTPLTL